MFSLCVSTLLINVNLSIVYPAFLHEFEVINAPTIDEMHSYVETIKT